MPTVAATRALRIAAYFPIRSSLVALGTAVPSSSCGKVSPAREKG